MTGGGVGQRGSGTLDLLVYFAVVAAGSRMVWLVLVPLLVKPFATFRAQVAWEWRPRPWLARLLARRHRRRR